MTIIAKKKLQALSLLVYVINTYYRVNIRFIKTFVSKVNHHSMKVHIFTPPFYLGQARYLQGSCIQRVAFHKGPYSILTYI